MISIPNSYIDLPFNRAEQSSSSSSPVTVYIIFIGSVVSFLLELISLGHLSFFISYSLALSDVIFLCSDVWTETTVPTNLKYHRSSKKTKLTLTYFCVENPYCCLQNLLLENVFYFHFLVLNLPLFEMYETIFLKKITKMSNTGIGLMGNSYFKFL